MNKIPNLLCKIRQQLIQQIATTHNAEDRQLLQEQLIQINRELSGK